MMDLNYLLKRRQQERMRADTAACDASRRAHEGLANQFEDEIRRRTSGRVNLYPVIPA